MHKLHDWYLKQSAHPPSLSNCEAFHLFCLAKAVFTLQSSVGPQWPASIREVFAVKSALLQHILDTDALAVTLDTSLVDIYGILAEKAIKHHQVDQVFDCFAKLADGTGLAAFRFLVAWISFNLNDFDRCIDECEKVNEPYGPIHTLLGQAFLESGRVESAIDALKVAAEIAPSDPLPIVQLVKAYMVSGRQLDCFKTIDRCRKLLGNNLEIECLASMAILSGNHRPESFCHHTLSNIAAQLQADPSDSDAFAIGMELAAELNLKDWASRYAECWDSSRLANPQEIAKELAKILKRNQARNWHDISQVILDKTLAILKQTDLKRVMQ